MFPDNDECAITAPESNESTVIDCDQLSLRDQRFVVFNILYALDSFDYNVSFEAVVDNFCRGFHYTIQPDGTIFQRARAMVDGRNELDEQIKPLLDNWRFDRIGTCTKLVLRIALWELLHTDIAPSVVINEAVELAKCFAELDAHKFVNGVLDEWLKRSGKKITAEVESESSE